MHTQSPRRLTFVSSLFLFAAALLGREPTAQAHALWNDPMPRDMMDGYKPPSPGFVLPCGVARRPTQPMNTAAAGSTKTVRFTETVAHPGCFLIDFAKSDTDTFERLTVVKRTNARMFTASVTFPNEPCTNCILRLRQFMLANDTAACPPTTINDMASTLYYSCANYTLTGGGGGDASVPADGGVVDAPAADVARDSGGGTGGGGGSSTGTGGSSGSGGSGGASAGTGGSTGSGGSSAGTGGSTAGTGGSTGSGGSSAGTGGSVGGGNTGGGGCAVAAGSPVLGAPLAFLLIGLLAVVRRRR